MKEIIAAFDVHSFVQRKYTRSSEKMIHVLEVMEILTTTCYAGTQIFYLCRSMLLEKLKNYEFKTEYWQVGHGFPKDLGDCFLKYREDELVPADQSTIDIITEAKPAHE